MNNPYDSLREQLKERFEYWQSDIEDDDVLDFSAYDLKEAIEKSEHFYLYQYRRPDYYSIRNLETQKIHLSSNGSLNDIYEGLPSGSSKDYEKETVLKLYDLALVSCFTETHNNQLMWSHYADSHKGFCVQYDLKLLQDEPFQILKHTFPVMYSRARKIFKNLEKLKDQLQELREAIEKDCIVDDLTDFDNVLPIFINKSLDWEYESEWRIVYTKKHIYDFYDILQSDEYSLLKLGNIPFSCISGVYIGVRTEKEIKDNIIEICDRLSKKMNKRIPVYVARLSNDSYDILFDEIKYN